MILLPVFGLFLCSVKFAGAVPMGTAFTYQGLLMDHKKPANGMYDIQASLYDDYNDLDPNMGLQIAPTFEANDVNIVDGHLTLSLDFGSDIFDGNAVWLETAVRPGDSTDANDFVTLIPRLKIRPVPYALQTRGIFADNTGNVGIGTTSPRERLHVAGSIRIADGNEGPNKVLTSDANGTATWQAPSGSGLPTGVIVMWSGSMASIPTGWALCDGANGTPDLRDRFIVGATYDDGGIAKTSVKGTPMQTGGESEHTLTVSEIPSHSHPIRYKSSGHGTPGSDIFASNVSGDVMYQQTGGIGGGIAHENCPPFFALAFIMKL